MGKYIFQGKTLKEWSGKTGLPVRLLQRRLRDFYDPKKILAPKIKQQVPRGSIKDFVCELAARQGVTRKAIYQRMNRGWTKEEIINGARNTTHSGQNGSAHH